MNYRLFQTISFSIPVGEEEEMQSIDVSTVAGYEQIVAVWEARAVVDSVLGRRAWKDLFPAMCRRRLRPTPWLNKVICVKIRRLSIPVAGK